MVKRSPKGVKKWHSEPASSGYRYKRTFKKPGTYKIICTLHEEMTMTISKDARRKPPQPGRREQRRDAHLDRGEVRDRRPPMGELALQFALGDRALAKSVGEQPSSPIQARGVTQTVPFALSQQGSGKPLDPSAQTRLEGAGGGSLGDVRVHEADREVLLRRVVAERVDVERARERRRARMARGGRALSRAGGRGSPAARGT